MDLGIRVINDSNGRSDSRRWHVDDRVRFEILSHLTILYLHGITIHWRSLLSQLHESSSALKSTSRQTPVLLEHLYVGEVCLLAPHDERWLSCRAIPAQTA